jgi:hypothetical protein
MIEIWLAAVQRGLAAAKNTEDVEIGGSRGSRGSEIWSLNKINDLQDIGHGTPHEKAGVPAYEAENIPKEQLLSTSETPGTRGTPDFNKAGGILGASAPSVSLRTERPWPWLRRARPSATSMLGRRFSCNARAASRNKLGAKRSTIRAGSSTNGASLPIASAGCQAIYFVPREGAMGLVWWLKSRTVTALGPEHAGVGQPAYDRVTRREWVNPYARLVRPVSLSPILERRQKIMQRVLGR